MSTPARRKRINSMSETRKARMKVYMKAHREYLRTHPFCEVCEVFWGSDIKPDKSTDIHHTRGRAGSLLADTRFWKAVCRSCHNVIHDNPKLAKEFGLLAHAGEWNVPPRD